MYKMGFGKQLIVTGGCAGILLLGAIAASVDGIHELQQEITHVGNETGKKALLCGQLQGYSAKMRGAVRGAILYSTSEVHRPELASRSSSEFNEFADAVASISKQMETFSLTDAERGSTAQVRAAVQDWRPVVADIVEKSSSGEFGTGLTASTMHSVKLADRLDEATAVLVKAQTQAFANSAARSSQLIERVWYTIIPMIGLAIAAAFGAASVLLRGLRVVLRVTNELSDGADQVADAASQVAACSQSLAQGSSQQAASLEETSASTEEIDSMARRNSDNVQAAAAEMDKTRQVVAKANHQLELMLSSMKEISDSSGRISNIIKVIDEIASQTNILALNAAVEAARAGDAGLGFAVVADEVRNLAQRSAQAAKDTAALIQESIEKSSLGSRNLDLMVAGIRTITSSADHVKSFVDQVSDGSQEQTRGLAEVTKAIAQMEQVTQATAANAEESAASAEELTAQAETLRDLVGQLKVMMHGGRRDQS